MVAELHSFTKPFVVLNGAFPADMKMEPGIFTIRQPWEGDGHYGRPSGYAYDDKRAVRRNYDKDFAVHRC